MSDNKNNIEDNDEKLHISKSALQNVRDMKKQREEEEQQRQAELQRKIAENEKRAREAREKRLEQERRELIRMKQGIAEESEIISEEPEEEIKLSFFGKIGNFFYHAKWWLVMAVPTVLIFSFLIYSLATKPRPDMAVIVIGENIALGEQSQLSEYVASFCKDNNENGEVLVSVYYIPYSDDPQVNYANGIDTKLTTQMQSASSVIVFANKKIGSIIKPEDVFEDLESLYPDNENVKDYKFMLSDTDIAEKIGLEKEELSDDDEWFVAIRRPKGLLYSNKSDMQKTYDRDFPVFDSIINDLSK